MKKKFASREGFTLGELSVVIAILGILAAVAVPAYSGYLKKANDAAIVTELDAIKTAAQAANASAGDTISSVELDDADTVIVTPVSGKSLADNFEDDFELFYTGTESISTTSGVVTITIADIDLSDTSYASGATWTPADGWEAN